jgi:hypothetical protein
MKRMDWRKKYRIGRRSIFVPNVINNPLKKSGVASPGK